MNRSLQSALEKRTRMGAWQSRVYRLERGYLSVWPDVASVTAQEQPSRAECLFQKGQVAVVTDQGECVSQRGGAEAALGGCTLMCCHAF